ncbi:MAG: hypothetical protein RKO66_18185 [Candidatus Contendobacter sp.]|nr:hypothetical protein [Candidatus Contendobacter sp.]MDS4059897.1 hypothetical protein [Candidatus Contendobacter sp.]
MMPTNADDFLADSTKPTYDYWRKETHWQRRKRLQETERRARTEERQPRWQRELSLRQASRAGRAGQEAVWDEA